MGLERALGRGIVDESGRHEPDRLPAERLGDTTERVALGAGRPVAAGEWHDGRGDRRRRVLQRVGDRRDRGAVADADDRAVADDPAQDLGREPADHPAGEVLRAGDRRGEMDGVESVGVAQRVRRRGSRAGPVDDPDLDDPLGAGTLEQPRDLRPSHPEALGDRVLGLAELVVETAGLDQLFEVAHASGPPCTSVLNKCASHARIIRGRAWAVNRGRRCLLGEPRS